MGTNNILEIVDCIIEEIEELRGKPSLTEMELGELLAYAETLSIIQSACAGYDLAEINLNFDVDQRYLLNRA